MFSVVARDTLIPDKSRISAEVTISISLLLYNKHMRGEEFSAQNPTFIKTEVTLLSG